MAEASASAPAPMNRREFLYYIWGASIALILAGGSGAVLWFAFPRFREGEFGGKFPIPASTLPQIGVPPQENAAGRFWLVNTEQGLLAIYKVCTHLGCLYKWVPVNERFECPCHGSKFSADGNFLEGPAPRHLDRFVVEAVDSAGNVLASTTTGDANTNPFAGSPLPLPDGTVEVRIDTGQRVEGALR